MCVFNINNLDSVKNNIASNHVWAAFDGDRPVAYMILKKVVSISWLMMQDN
jgi:hypothetical protein